MVPPLLLTEPVAVAVDIDVKPVGKEGAGKFVVSSDQIVTIAISPAANEGVVAVIEAKLKLLTIVLDCAANVSTELAPYHSLNDISTPDDLLIKPRMSASLIPASVAVVPPASMCISLRDSVPDAGSAIRLCHML